MIKTGVDMLEISRMEQAIEKHKEMKNVFTDAEMQYTKQKLEKGEIRGYKFFECLAGMFCAKEAVLKALGVGIVYKTALKDVEVLHKTSGEPFAKLNGKLAKMFEKVAENEEIAISIAHDGGFAIASCVLEI